MIYINLLDLRAMILHVKFQDPIGLLVLEQGCHAQAESNFPDISLTIP